MSKQWKCTECVKHGTDACYNGSRFDDDNCKYMLIDSDYAYQQGRADAERDLQNSEEWNDYLAKVIADAKADAYEDAEKRLRYLWKQYEADKENVPKPQFTEAIALITMLELDEEEKSGTITECPMCMDCPDNCPLDKEKKDEL